MAEEQEYKVQLNRYEERLIGIRNEIEELEKLKSTITLDIDKFEKHTIYLHGIHGGKEEEIALKTTTTAGLDIQIADKQAQFDKVQGELSEIEIALRDTTEKVAMKQAEYDALAVAIDEKVRGSEELHALAHQKHAEADEKLRRIREFKETL